MSEVGFDFGNNWLEFTQESLDEDKLSAAQKSLVELIGQENIKGKTFLDIGCGSGIFSIAAKRLGAKNVVAFDISKESIQSSKINTKKYLGGNEIDFHVFSILDSEFKKFGTFDIVYSWGVLHHTGDMWQAIKNASELVNDNGLFVIAIYNKHWTSPCWKFIKKIYNLSPSFIKLLMVWLFYVAIAFTKLLITGKNPFIKKRGMDFYHDVIDWVGGYPYEYASIEQIENYVCGLGFSRHKSLPTQGYTGNNEFVFRKTGHE
ncbi:MAG: class I SAM-dependent methyltransferase [Candidatus Omnitrophota bacterium]